MQKIILNVRYMKIMAKNKNTSSTRYYSDMHEKSICKALGARQTSNSGAGHFSKGDVIHNEASMLIEAKCSMSEKQSFSIKKEWIEKNYEEARAMRKSNSALCFTFEPQGKNYYVIDEKLMRYLILKLAEDNE